MHPSPHTNKHTNTHAHPHTISPVVITTHAPKHARTHARTHANTSRHSQHHHQHPHSPTHPQRTAPTPHTMVVRDHDLALLARRNSIRVTDRPTDSLPDRPTDRPTDKTGSARTMPFSLGPAFAPTPSVGRSVRSVPPHPPPSFLFHTHQPTNKRNSANPKENSAKTYPRMAILTNSWPS